VSIVTTNGEKLGAVGVLDATWFALHAIAPEAVIVGWYVADLVPTIAPVVGLVATLRDTLLVIPVSIQITDVADETGLAVLVSSAATQVGGASVAADGVGVRTVFIRTTARATTFLSTVMAVILGATVEAVVMCWNAADLVESNTVVIRMAHLNLNTPATIVTDITIRAMGVLKALGRADIIYAGLPVETVTGPAFIGAVAFIVDGEDTGWTLRPKVELFIKGERPLVAILPLTLPVTVLLRKSKARAAGTLHQAALPSGAALPEPAAVL